MPWLGKDTHLLYITVVLRTILTGVSIFLIYSDLGMTQEWYDTSHMFQSKKNSSFLPSFCFLYNVTIIYNDVYRKIFYATFM